MRHSVTVELAVLWLLGLVGAGVCQSQESRGGRVEGGVASAPQPVLTLKFQAESVATRAGRRSAVEGGASGQTSTATEVLRLSLKEAVDLALKQSPQIQIANLRVLESHGAYVTGRSGYRPHLNVMLADSYRTTNLQTLGITIPGVPSRTDPFQVFDARPVFQQTILDLSLLKRIDVLREQIRQSEWDARAVRESTLLSVVQLYLQVLVADSRTSTTEARLRTAEALLNRAKEFLEAGTGKHLDEARAKVEFQNESRLLVEARRDREAVRLLLMKTVGLDLHQKTELSDKLELRSVEPINVSEVAAVALESRAEMKSLQAKLRAAMLEKQRAKAERYPTVGFSTDYGLLGTSPAHNVSTYTVQGTFNLPILQGGRIKGEMEAADARYKQVEQELQEQKLEIQLDIQTALVQLEAARQAAEVAQQATVAARTSLDLARQEFEAGVTDNLDVISAQEAVAIAEGNEINSMFDFMQARANLARAQGDVVNFLK